MCKLAPHIYNLLYNQPAFLPKVTCFQASFLLRIIHILIHIHWFFFTSLLFLLPLWKETYLCVKESGQSTFAYPEVRCQQELLRHHCHHIKQMSILNCQWRESQCPIGRVTKHFSFPGNIPVWAYSPCTLINGAPFYSQKYPGWMINV